MAASPKVDGSSDVTIFRLNDFETVKELGRGGEAVVWKTNVSGYGTLALKVFKSGLPEDIMKEANILMKRHRHPNIIQLYGLFEKVDPLTGAGFSGYFMEYSDRGSLDTVIRNKNLDYPHSMVYSWILCAAYGLDFLHKGNIIHRDIKPQNMIVTGDGVLKLSDFGMAKNLMSNATNSRVVCGTPGYMAPEIVNRQYSAASDIYAFSMSIWEMFHRRQISGLPDQSDYFFYFCHLKDETYRPTCDEILPEKIKNLLRTGWSTDPVARPGVLTILKVVEELKSSESSQICSYISSPMSSSPTVVQSLRTDSGQGTLSSRLEENCRLEDREQYAGSKEYEPLLPTVYSELSANESVATEKDNGRVRVIKAVRVPTKEWSGKLKAYFDCFYTQNDYDDDQDRLSKFLETVEKEGYSECSSGEYEVLCRGNEWYLTACSYADKSYKDKNWSTSPLLYEHTTSEDTIFYCLIHDPKAPPDAEAAKELATFVRSYQQPKLGDKKDSVERAAETLADETVPPPLPPRRVASRNQTSQGNRETVQKDSGKKPSIDTAKKSTDLVKRVRVPTKDWSGKLKAYFDTFTERDFETDYNSLLRFLKEIKEQYSTRGVCQLICRSSGYSDASIYVDQNFDADKKRTISLQLIECITSENTIFYYLIYEPRVAPDELMVKELKTFVKSYRHPASNPLKNLVKRIRM